MVDLLGALQAGSGSEKRLVGVLPAGSTFQSESTSRLSGFPKLICALGGSRRLLGSDTILEDSISVSFPDSGASSLPQAGNAMDPEKMDGL